ncbi:MAG: YceI family protein [Chitinophagales bacterium]|nr:YceI family protein [Chitinophagales bacterium]
MATTNWNLDSAHSEVTFKVKHLVISTVSGKFKQFSSAVSTEGDDFTQAQIKFDIDANSIDTGMEMRDNHLRGDDFFNAEAFPTLQFVSTGVRSLGGSDYAIDGNLTVRDVTKPITLKAEFGGIAVDPYGQTKAGFEVEGKINRQEFNLTWNALTEAGGAVVSDEVKFQANVQYIKG